MTLRDNCTPEQLRAHGILDLARSGGAVTRAEIVWALVTLGEPV